LAANGMTVASVVKTATATGTSDFDFEVLDPPELIPVLHALSGRLARAADLA
jgi:hypothetical protein